jgi:hypothetical protein
LHSRSERERSNRQEQRQDFSYRNSPYTSKSCSNNAMGYPKRQGKSRRRSGGHKLTKYQDRFSKRRKRRERLESHILERGKN